jgi:ABC-type polysaccharide transport system permease subunit
MSARSAAKQKEPGAQITWKYVKKSLVRNWQLYVLFALPFIWLVLFRYWPMFGVQIAFKDFRPGDTILGAAWIGFGNFTKFFNHYLFWDLIKNTIGITLYNLVAGFPIPIIFALALNATLRNGFKKVVQYVTYMPYFISTVVMVGIILQLLNPRLGVINNIIELMGGTRVDFMSKPEWFSSIYVWSGIWQNTGWNSIIYIAALSGISQDLHEAAMIDGASRFGRIIHVDIPGILPTMVVLLIMNCGQLMTLGFEKIFLMQNPMNLRVSQVISTYVYTVGLKNAPPEFSYGTAIDLFNSIINLCMITVVNKLAKTFGDTSLW